MVSLKKMGALWCAILGDDTILFRSLDKANTMRFINRWNGVDTDEEV
jgi:hypothetical protein